MIFVNIFQKFTYHPTWVVSNLEIDYSFYFQKLMFTKFEIDVLFKVFFAKFDFSINV
jgi:hypothetical protein